MKKHIIVFIFPLLIGCAYARDSHLYSLQPTVPKEKAQKVAGVVETTLVQKGLVLKSRYHDTYPQDIAVTILEIPRRPEEKRRDPMLIILIKSGNVVQLKHSELWLQWAFSNRHRPSDYIKDITPELVSAIKNELGLEIEIVPTNGD